MKRATLGQSLKRETLIRIIIITCRAETKQMRVVRYLFLLINNIPRISKLVAISCACISVTTLQVALYSPANWAKKANAHPHETTLHLLGVEVTIEDNFVPQFEPVFLSFDNTGCFKERELAKFPDKMREVPGGRERNSRNRVLFEKSDENLFPNLYL